jgi:hypothetical protein
MVRVTHTQLEREIFLPPLVVAEIVWATVHPINRLNQPLDPNPLIEPAPDGSPALALHLWVRVRLRVICAVVLIHPQNILTVLSTPRRVDRQVDNGFDFICICICICI